MGLVGYARVSTSEQSTDLQRSALNEAGCTRIFEDKASGTRADRPQLAAALDYLRAGDTLVVWRLDRLGRSMQHLIQTLAGLHEAGVGFKSLNENIDTSTSTGKLTFHLFGALAEFEKSLIRDRTKAGLEAARARGSKPGRKPSLSAEQVELVRRLHAEGEHTIAELAALVGGVSRATIYRAVAAEQNGDATEQVVA